MLQDLRFGSRMMRKSPGFTAAAIVTLALGIGANTAIFSVVNAVLLRGLPLRDPGRLAWVSAWNSQRGIQGGGFSLLAYDLIRDRNRSFRGITAYCGDGFALTGGAEPEQLAAARVAPNFFDVLGTPPALGRGFLPAEGEPGAARVAVISHKLWERRFASDPGILGRAVTLSQESYTIIGIAPPNFPFPFPDVDVWATRLMDYSGFTPEQIRLGAGYLFAIARLQPGATLESGENELASLFKEHRQAHPNAPDADPNGRLQLVTLQESFVGGIRPALLALTAAVGLVLLIACANVAGLMMARATGRAKEMAMRAALGATRGQLARQLVAESALLSASGAAVGIVLARWGVAWLVSSSGTRLAGFQAIRIDASVLAFTLAVSVGTGVLFGLLPALQASRPDLNSILRDAGWGTTAGTRHRMRGALVAAQAALSIVLLIGAGLLVESFRRLESVNPGFDPHHALTMRVNLPPARYPGAVRRTQFLRQAVERLESVPGIRSASASLALPLGVAVMSPILADGQPNVTLGQRPLALWNSVTPGYFHTLGIPLLRGRDLTWADDENAPRVVVVSQTLAHRFWPNENAIGRHLVFTRFQTPFEIVGIAADTRSFGLEAAPGMVLYTSYAQWTWPRMVINVRTEGDPSRFARIAPAQIMAVDRDQPVTNVQTVDDFLADDLAQRRQTMYLIAAFAAIAMLLSVVGLYGMMAYFVAQRTTEIGIRRAVGAQTGDILRLVMVQAMRLAVAGIAAGLLASAALTRLIAGMLFHVSATDPATYAGIAALFLAVALVASYIPAVRATRVDPLEALRSR